MKKLLTLITGTLFAVSASAITPYKALYVEASVFPSGAGTVYLSPKNEEDAGYVKEKSATPGETAFIKCVLGENGSTDVVGCNARGGVYEVVIDAVPSDSYELVCYADKVREDGIYRDSDVYPVIIGNGELFRRWSVEWTGNGDWINIDNPDLPDRGNDRDAVYNNFDNYVSVNPDTHVYAIFRKIGDELPRYNGDETITISDKATDGESFYATMYYSYKNLEVPANAEAETYIVNDGRLAVKKTYAAGDVIPAKTGVVVKTATPGDYNFEYTKSEGEGDSDNMLRGTDKAKQIEDNNETIENRHKFYMLSLNADSEENSIGFYFDKDSNGGVKIKNGAHKAYLDVPPGIISSAKGYPFGGDATGIESLIVNEKANANEVYDLQGRRVVRPAKGIYIVNGKKIVVK